MTIPPTSQELLELLARIAVKLAAGLGVFAAAFVGALIARHLLAAFLKRLKTDPTVTHILTTGIFYGFLIMGAVSGLGTAGVNISPIVASLGLTGFALGFALRDAVSNYLAGILMLAYRPFRIGERVSVAGSEGAVREINLRYTLLVSDDGSRQLIPNGMIFSNPVKITKTPPQTAAAA